MTPNNASPTTRPTTRSRRRWSVEQKDELLRRFTASGMNAAKFCRKEGLSAVTFSAWRRKAGVGRFARVRIDDAGNVARTGHAVLITVNGALNVSVAAGTDPEWLARLLRVLRED